MEDITQIRIGKFATGIIGLKAALAQAAHQCKGMDDDRIGEFLVELLSKSNYIETRVKTECAQAFLNQYKIKAWLEEAAKQTKS